MVKKKGVRPTEMVDLAAEMVAPEVGAVVAAAVSGSGSSGGGGGGSDYEQHDGYEVFEYSGGGASGARNCVLEWDAEGSPSSAAGACSDCEFVFDVDMSYQSEFRRTMVLVQSWRVMATILTGTFLTTKATGRMSCTTVRLMGRLVSVSERQF